MTLNGPRSQMPDNAYQWAKDDPSAWFLDGTALARAFPNAMVTFIGGSA